MKQEYHNYQYFTVAVVHFSGNKHYISFVPHHLLKLPICDIYGTYTSKIFVQQLYVSVDDLQGD